MSNSRSIWFRGAAALALASAGLVATAARAAEGASEGAVTAVDEIVVTAQKREESINRVGLSVSAISGSNLEKQQIHDVEGLARIVPGLSYTNSNTNTPVYTLRGVGFYENSLGAAPAVTVYVDEVPLPYPALTSETSLDLERVEVLKGPQGILFGQNSTGGAINYIARKPTRTFEAGADVSYARFNDLRASAFVSGPISETLRGRVAVMGERADDWQYSYTRDDSTGKVRKLVGRVLLDWEPNERLRFGLNVNGWINKSDPQVGSLAGLGLQNTSPTFADGSARDNRIPILLSYPLAPHNNRAADWSPNMEARGDEWMWQSALRADLDVAENLTVTSITAYSDYKRNNRADYDGIEPNNDDLYLNTGTIRSFVQELRIANTGEARLRWLAGANFEASKVNEYDALFYHDSTIADFLNNLAGLPRLPQWDTNPFHTNQRMRTYAAFANAEYDLSPQFTLKAGARFTQANRSAVACTNDPGDNRSSKVFNFLNGFNVLGPGDCYTVRQVRNAQGQVVSVQPLDEFRDKLNQNNLSWRVGLDYKPSDTTLLYGNIARGYKAGGFPAASAVVTEQYAPVTQEKVIAYEAGFKTSLLDRRLDLTGAAYYYDYTDKQLRSQGIYLPFGILNNLQNIPKSYVKGVELEAVARPIDGLRLGAALSYNRARVKEYVGINAQGRFGDFAGAPVPFTPEWSLNGSADYAWSLTEDLRAFVGGSVAYRSKASGAIGGEAIERIDAYTLVDLRAGVESADGDWRVQVWGKNVTDKYYWTNVVHTFDTIIRYNGRPATYGATLTYRFH